MAAGILMLVMMTMAVAQTWHSLWHETVNMGGAMAVARNSQQGWCNGCGTKQSTLVVHIAAKCRRAETVTPTRRAILWMQAFILNLPSLLPLSKLSASLWRPVCSPILFSAPAPALLPALTLPSSAGPGAHTSQQAAGPAPPVRSHGTGLATTYSPRGGDLGERGVMP